MSKVETKSSKNDSYQFYGRKVGSSDVKTLLRHVIMTNMKNEQEGRDKYPLCIWGTHGIGKTQIVEAFANEERLEFQYIAPAQFEEMGDLLGLPDIQGDKTVTLPPSWIPTTDYTGTETEGYRGGILLIDDVNRADDRILRGTMQLLQNYELATWKLPKGWQIVLTANPDGGDYSVTPMDDAMLTRMIHVTMKADPKEWAAWAESKDIDGRGIAFVLTYPEVFGSHATRTTFRSVTQFFEMIKEIPSTKENLGIIAMIGEGCLDEHTINKFIQFLSNNHETIISPEEILRAEKFETIEKKLQKIIFGGKKDSKTEDMRVDLSSLIANRLRNHMLSKHDSYDDLAIDNLGKFLTSKFIIKDILFDFVNIIARKSVATGDSETAKSITRIGNKLMKKFPPINTELLRMAKEYL